MASYQKSLSAVTAPSIGKTSSANISPREPSTLETVASLATNLLPGVTQGIKLYEAADKKEGAKDFNMGLVNLVEARNQNSITTAEFKTRSTELFVNASRERPEMTQSFTKAMQNTLGTVPFAAQLSGEVTVEERQRKLGQVHLPDGSPEAQIEAGREIEIRATNTAAVKAKLEAVTLRTNATEKENINAAIGVTENLIDNFNFASITTLALQGAAGAKNLNEKQLFAETSGGVTALLQQGRLELMASLKGSKQGAMDAALKRYELYEKNLQNIFNVDTGPLKLEDYSKFYTAFKNQTNMDAMQTTRTLSLLKDTIGSQALGSLMSNAIASNGSISGSLYDMVTEELGSLITETGETEKTVRLRHLMQVTKDPRASVKLSTNEDVRTTQITGVVLDVKKAMDSGSGPVQENQLEKYRNLSLNLANMTIEKINKPENLKIVMDSFLQSGHTKNLKVMKDNNSTNAKAVGKNIAVAATSSIMKTMDAIRNTGEGKLIQYNTELNKFEVLEAMTSEQRREENIKLKSGGGGVGTPRQNVNDLKKAGELVDVLNTSLDVAIAHKEYDEDFSSFKSDSQLKAYLVSVGQTQAGINVIRDGTLNLPKAPPSSSSVAEARQFIPSRKGTQNRMVSKLQAKIASERQESIQRMIRWTEKTK